MGPEKGRWRMGILLGLQESSLDAFSVLSKSFSVGEVNQITIVQWRRTSIDKWYRKEGAVDEEVNEPPTKLSL